MKTLGKFFLFGALFAFLFISCSDSDGDEISSTGPDFSISELQGNWDATEISFFYSGGDPRPEPDSYSVIGEGGTGSINIQSNGRFTLSVTPVGQNIVTFSGTMYFEDSEFFAIQFDDDPPNDPTYFGVTLTATTLTINGGPETAEWDFDDDGTDEIASVNLRFMRA